MRNMKKIIFLVKHQILLLLEKGPILIVISEPSPIASMEKYTKRIQTFDVLIVASEPSLKL